MDDRLEAALENIEGWLGLHECVNIIYVVDGYAINLMKQDDQLIHISAHGSSLKEALINVGNKL